MEPFNQSLITNPRLYAGTIAAQDADSVNITGGSITGITDLAIADGGTGASTAAGARTNLDVYSTAEVDEYLGPKATAGGVRALGSTTVTDQMVLPSTMAPLIGGKTNIVTLSLFAKTTTTPEYHNFFRTAKNAANPGLQANRSFEFNLEKVFGGESTRRLRCLWFVSSTLSYQIVSSPIVWTTDKWRHVAVVIDFTGATPSATFYVNGVSETGSLITNTGATYDPSTDVFASAFRVNSGAKFTGDARDAAIFNRALTATEVADLYRNGLAGIADADRWGSGNMFLGTDYSLSGGATIVSSTIDSITGINLPVSSGQITINNTVANRPYIKAGQKAIVAFDHTLTGGTPLTRLIVTGSESWISINSNTSGGRFEYEFTAAVSGSYAIQIRNFDASVVTTGDISNADYYVLGAIAAYPMDEGIGYQLHDISSNHYDGLLSTSGFTHLVPKTEGKVRVKAADASSAMYMLRAGDIIPTNSIVDNVLSEQCFVDLTNSAQTLDDYRIRLNPSGSDLQIQRSDGSNHQTLGTVTAPASLADVDVEVQYKQVIR